MPFLSISGSDFVEIFVGVVWPAPILLCCPRCLAAAFPLGWAVGAVVHIPSAPGTHGYCKRAQAAIPALLAWADP